MRLHEQRDELQQVVNEIHDSIELLMASINRKIASPYGDGSRSDLVNALTDVLPRLREMQWITSNVVTTKHPIEAGQ
jgi:hypothetical protein